MGADQEVDVAGASRSSMSRALAAALAAGEDRDRDAGRGGERRDRVEMLAREDFGRRHQRRLPAAFDHGRRREQRHHGLARADIALQQPQHAFGLGEIGDDLGDRARLRARQRIGQRLDQLLAQVPGAGGGAAGGPAQMRAHQRERELAGEQFVIGEPRPRRRCRARRRPGSAGRCSARSASRERTDSARARPSSGPAIPADPARVRARLDRLAHLVEAEPFGQRIDRLDQRQRGEARFVDHAVGMHHLQHAVVERRPCRRRSAARRPAGAFPGNPCAR